MTTNSPPPASDDWRSLQAGDRVRLVGMPTEFNQPGYQMHRDTLRVYRRLIERRRPVRIAYLDDWMLPWIRCQFRDRNGKIEYHWLALNHGGWVRVRRRA